jgi:hypothetical protein
MKIIITESQYNELNKVDDVYDGLDPYYRRRIDFIDIKGEIDRRIDNTTSKYIKLNPRGIAGRIYDIISGVVWDTIPYEWETEIEDIKKSTYVVNMIDKVKMKFGNYIKERLNKILEDEDNN